MNWICPKEVEDEELTRIIYRVLREAEKQRISAVKCKDSIGQRIV